MPCSGCSALHGVNPNQKKPPRPARSFSKEAPSHFHNRMSASLQHRFMIPGVIKRGQAEKFRQGGKLRKIIEMKELKIFKDLRRFCMHLNPNEETFDLPPSAFPLGHCSFM